LDLLIKLFQVNSVNNKSDNLAATSRCSDGDFNINVSCGPKVSVTKSKNRSENMLSLCEFIFLAVVLKKICCVLPRVVA
jgi:hypothetical protein